VFARSSVVVQRDKEWSSVQRNRTEFGKDVERLDVEPDRRKRRKRRSL
jgi:hypothetical protein